jgi:two-component system osmolarity sensor histidine kinase EnvZ
MQGIEDTHFSPLTLYLFVISILSVAGGWLFVRRLNRPLQALQKAARQVGKGQFPDPLPLDGSTEMISVTEAFNKMSAGIHQLESDRALMTAGISHDLRTPLTRIRLSSEMLPDEQDWIKDGIEHDIEDMNAIIDQFIDYARQDQEEATENVDINDLVTELANARSVEEAHTIELNLAELPSAKLRTVGIKRVLDNLIENAFRYGSPKISIKTEVNYKRRFITCVVRDFGKGIPQEDIPSLFAPFAQGDKARGSVGSGLGLAITKRIVESHGGEMLFSNHPHGGLCAGFKLPFTV